MIQVFNYIVDMLSNLLLYFEQSHFGVRIFLLVGFIRTITKSIKLGRIH